MDGFHWFRWVSCHLPGEPIDFPKRPPPVSVTRREVLGAAAVAGAAHAAADLAAPDLPQLQAALLLRLQEKGWDGTQTRWLPFAEMNIYIYTLFFSLVGFKKRSSLLEICSVFCRGPNQMEGGRSFSQDAEEDQATGTGVFGVAG